MTQKAIAMPFGTKPRNAVPGPLVLASQAPVQTHVPVQSDIAPTNHELVNSARARYFSNDFALSSTRAVQREPQADTGTKLVSIILSAIAVTMCVFGTFYWLTDGTMKLPGM